MCDSVVRERDWEIVLDCGVGEGCLEMMIKLSFEVGSWACVDVGVEGIVCGKILSVGVSFL